MKALTFQGTENVELRNDVDEPVLQSDSDVIVAVHRAGLCGSDLHQYHGRESVRRGTVPGHEFFGEVVAVGTAVRQFRVGDFTFAPFTTSCGGCFFCRDGLSSRCESGQLFGYLPPTGEVDSGSGIQGAQAEFVRVPLADSTLLSSKGLSPEQALLLGDNFTTGFFCADQAAIRPDGISVVIGCGSVGLSAIVAARHLGARTVIAVDPVPSRRLRAVALGATAVSPEEAAMRIEELAAKTRQIGADSVLEAVGHPSAQKLAFDLIRPGGVISSVGVHTREHFSFSPTGAYDRNVTYRTGRCPVRSYLDRILRLVAAGDLMIPVEQIVTESRLPLSQGAEAYRRFASRADDCVKILLAPPD